MGAQIERELIGILQSFLVSSDSRPRTTIRLPSGSTRPTLTVSHPHRCIERVVHKLD